jgi:DNA (cytosine-5)-methyltransferase 1
VVVDIKYIELFAGIAGFRYGIEKANSQNSPNDEGGTSQYVKRTFRCVWGNDIDKYASAIYRKQFGNKEHFEGDIRTVDPATIPDHDLIVGGFPCQSFSIAGKREAFSDIRGTLFFEICRIARAKRTPYLWLENVKGLLSAPYTEDIQEWDEKDFDENGEPTTNALKEHKAIPGTKGWVFLTILYTLWELGYDCQWQLLNSKDYGVPQNRERVFIIANSRDKRRPQVFPIGNCDNQDNELQRHVTGTITGRTGTSQSNGVYIATSKRETQEIVQAIDANYGKGNAGFSGSNRALVNMPQAQRIRDINGISSTLQGLSGGQGAKTGLYEIHSIGQPSKGTSIKRDGIAYALRSGQGGAETPKIMIDTPILAQSLQTDGQLRQGSSWGTNNPQSSRNIRRLTPIECERLQGFPEITNCAIIELWKSNCLDNQRNFVNAESLNPKLLKYVGSVENADYQASVPFVENNTYTKPQQTEKHVQPDVLISCGENIVEISSQGKLILSVKIVDKESQSLLLMPLGSFVLMIVGINTIVERIIDYGKVESRQNERCLIPQVNGERLVKLSGKGIMRLAECAKNNLIIPKEPMKSITLNHLDINILEQELITLFWYVINVMDGYILDKILSKNTLRIGFVIKHGWTKYGIDKDGKQIEISDTQRYKCCGNAVTTNVITVIGKKLMTEIN